MTAYLDSSALIKLYVRERESVAVARYVKRLSAPIYFSHLHELELKNGLRLKTFRREVFPKDGQATIHSIDQDLASGVLQRPILSWVDVFRAAFELSEKYSAILGCRSLDLLHVASAVLVQVTDFLTFDDRQAALASRAGLRVPRV